MKGQMRIYLKARHESLSRNRDSIANDEGRESSGGMMIMGLPSSSFSDRCYPFRNGRENSGQTRQLILPGLL